MNNLRAPIFEEKVVDFIVELAKPDERKVTPQELMAADQEAETAAGARRPRERTRQFGTRRHFRRRGSRRGTWPTISSNT